MPNILIIGALRKAPHLLHTLARLGVNGQSHSLALRGHAIAFDLLKQKLTEYDIPWGLVVFHFDKVIEAKTPLPLQSGSLSVLQLRNMARLLPTLQPYPFLVVSLISPYDKSCAVIRRGSTLSKDYVVGMSRKAFLSFCSKFVSQGSPFFGD